METPNNKGSLYCKICDKWFKTARMMVRHLKTYSKQHDSETYIQESIMNDQNSSNLNYNHNNKDGYNSSNDIDSLHEVNPNENDINDYDYESNTNLQIDEQSHDEINRSEDESNNSQDEELNEHTNDVDTDFSASSNFEANTDTVLNDRERTEQWIQNLMRPQLEPHGLSRLAHKYSRTTVSEEVSVFGSWMADFPVPQTWIDNLLQRIRGMSQFNIENAPKKLQRPY